LQITEKKSYIIHPFLFAIFPIVFTFTFNIHLLPFNDVIIPLVAILIFSFILWIVLRFFLTGKKAGLIISLSLVLFFTYGHLYIFLNDLSDGISELGRHRYLLSLYAICFIVGITYFVKTKRKLDNATTIANGIAIALIVISIVNMGIYNFERTSLFESSKEISNTSLNTVYAEKTPDIYYIIFDGYTNSDVLEKYFGYDNQDLLSFLNQNGFYIPSNSFSNYAKSNLSIPSSLNMMHMTFLQDAAESNDEVQLNDLLAESKVMKEFDAYGQCVSISMCVSPSVCVCL